MNDAENGACLVLLAAFGPDLSRAVVHGVVQLVSGSVVEQTSKRSGGLSRVTRTEPRLERRREDECQESRCCIVEELQEFWEKGGVETAV